MYSSLDTRGSLDTRVSLGTRSSLDTRVSLDTPAALSASVSLRAPSADRYRAGATFHTRHGSRFPPLCVGLVIPLRGPAGIFGPSGEACAQLAAEETNRSLARGLRLVVVDGGAPPEEVARELDVLVSAGAVDAVTGWHLSAVRDAIAPVVADRVPYVYTPPCEGSHTRGVFMAGETPERQVIAALRWLGEELGVRGWCVVGSDDPWSRRSVRLIRRHAEQSRLWIEGEIYVPLGTEDFGAAFRMLERTVGPSRGRKGARGVLMFLVGADAVRFNRAFAAAGLDGELLRFSPLMEENMLLGSGPAGTREIYSAAGFFGSLVTRENLEFVGRYTARFGAHPPPLSGPGESCYEGVRLLAELARHAGSLDVRTIWSVSSEAVYRGPRGMVRLRGRHLDQRVYLAHADGLQFDVVAELPSVQAEHLASCGRA